jgi:dCMP deaminase
MEAVDRISLDRMYMEIAKVVSRRSTCKRKKVGAIIVKDKQILSEGYNGTPAGWRTNCCEDESGSTKDVVLHAESNAITKLAKSTNSAEGGTIYCTLQPCLSCSKLVHQAGIVRVVYEEKYGKDESLRFLEQAGIEVVQMSE